MTLRSDTQFYSMIKITIIDDDVVIICPTDLIGRDNIGTKGVRLGQKFLGEPVSD